MMGKRNLRKKQNRINSRNAISALMTVCFAIAAGVFLTTPVRAAALDEATIEAAVMAENRAAKTMATAETAAKNKTMAETTTETETTETTETTEEITTEEGCVHEYQTVIKAATNKKNGYRQEICSKCGDEKEKVVIYKIKSVKLARTSYIYDGRVKKPTVKAYDSRGNVIDGGNYKVTYQAGRKKTGRYSVTLEFSGDYSATVVRYFNIMPKGAVIKDIKGGQGCITIRPKNQGGTITGYQVEYSKDRKFSSGTVKKNFKSGQKTCKLTYLDVNQKYYVRVRTYRTVGDKRLYSTWSEKKAVRTLKYQNMSIVSTKHQKYTYEEMVKDLKQLQRRYKDHCTVNVIGTSPDERDLYEVIIGNPDADKHLIVLANLHAREYMTTQLSMKQIEYYLNNYNSRINGIKVSDVCEEVAIHILPSCNPDGTAISQFGFDAIKNNKLRRNLYRMGGEALRWKANARGVDLNQNWNVKFEIHGKKGQSGYSGKKPASEPEVKAILKVISRAKEKGKIVGFVSYHSSGEVIYGRYAASLSNEMKTTIDEMNEIAVGQTGYLLCGSTDIACNQSREYLMYRRSIPGITIEIGTGSSPLPSSQFPVTWNKNRNLVFLEAALFCE